MQNREDKKPNRLVLLDAHAIIHRAYHALPDFSSSKGEPTGALYGLSNMLMKIINDLKPDYMVACYDLPQKTFRHEAYDAYKAGRAKTDEALISQLKSSRLIFEAFNIPIYDAPGFEADDVLGTIVEKYKNGPLKDEDMQIVIASGDMDTMQLVEGDKVQIYTLKKGINDTILYDEKAVLDRFHFSPKLLPDFKGLRGDPSDNIIGIKGIGEKTAEILITHFGTIEEIYKQLGEDNYELRFKEAGISSRIIELLKNNEEEAIFSKTLATIRKDAPINFSLPQKTFWENLNSKKIEEVFSTFEFRSLLGRLQGFFENNGKTNPAEFSQVLGPLGPQSSARPFKNSPDLSFHTSPRKLQEASIALWLIDSDMSNPTNEDILSFTKTDSLDAAFDCLIKRLKEGNLFQVFEKIEKPIIKIVKQMEDFGILVDKEYFNKISLEYHKELDVLTQKIYKMAGVEFNINSPKQLGEVLFQKMGIKSPSRNKNKSGNFSTKISVLEELEEGNPIIKEIMSYRELQKLLSTYIDTIPNMLKEDGRLHARFLQNGTTTGRFSSQDPNLQNLPIKTELGKKIRNGFIASKGYKLVAFDYSQIELRIAAMLSSDIKMTKVFEENKDIHSGVASFVFGVPIEKVDSEMRRQAKVINFGIIYGMGVSALRKNLGGTKEEAQKFYDNYFNQFSGVRDFLENVKNFARKNNYTETLFGRRRYFPNINSRIPFLKNMAERTAINAPIQGTAADIIKLAIRYATEDLEKAGISEKAHLIMQIHDELVYEIEDSSLKEAQKIIEDAMKNVLKRSYLAYKTKIPLLVHTGVGENLGEVK